MRAHAKNITAGSHTSCSLFLGQRGAVNPTKEVVPIGTASSVRLKPFLGRGGALTRTEFLDVLSDPDYIAGVREKLNMIATYETATRVI